MLLDLGTTGLGITGLGITGLGIVITGLGIAVLLGASDRGISDATSPAKAILPPTFLRSSSFPIAVWVTPELLLRSLPRLFRKTFLPRSPKVPKSGVGCSLPSLTITTPLR